MVATRSPLAAVGRVINISKHGAVRATVLKPEMLRAVDLDQLAKILPPRSGLLNRLAADQEPMTLEELLARQGGTEVRVMLAHEVQDEIRVDRRQPPVALLAAF